ncbi:hypothetical protein K435DRAFT_906483 [Dendrothele bispora CBS 962.96]|uniref:Uncharacterized protein n=1 Tax=Dendrothele bispora (strain CBS 962.96) TaxID=1314807 RepID=A0A4S8LS14_DENBC|nr:hypothetical protein K435DRAFT_906483 [Dendrothele bispora CBS 962.96]
MPDRNTTVYGKYGTVKYGLNRTVTVPSWGGAEPQTMYTRKLDVNVDKEREEEGERATYLVNPSSHVLNCQGGASKQFDKLPSVGVVGSGRNSCQPAAIRWQLPTCQCSSSWQLVAGSYFFNLNDLEDTVNNLEKKLKKKDETDHELANAKCS